MSAVPNGRRILAWLGAALVLASIMGAYGLYWRGQAAGARRGYESFLFEYARRCDASAFRFALTDLGIRAYLNSPALREIVDAERERLAAGASCESVEEKLRAADFPMPPRRPDSLRMDATVPAASPSVAPEPEPEPAASPSPPLSKKVRQVIKRRMQGHGERMGLLVSSVWFVDYADAERAAKALVDQAQLRKDIARDAVDLDFTFPARFFSLLVELEERSGKLADAAHRKDGAQLAAGFARLSETCINCHAEYLEVRR